MLVDIPDPAWTSSERARANFRLAARIALGFVALIWLIHALNWALDLELGRFGVRPREFAGLPGILLAPLPARRLCPPVNQLPAPAGAGDGDAVPLSELGPQGDARGLSGTRHRGVAVRQSVIRACGRERTDLRPRQLYLPRRRDQAGSARHRGVPAGCLSIWLHGLGDPADEPGVSWETHLAAAMIGLALAIALRHLDIPPRKRYEWEDEADETGDDGDG